MKNQIQQLQAKDIAMLPDFGTFYTQRIGNEPVNLVVPNAAPMVIKTAKKLFAINFVVEVGEQRMMGTLEYSGIKEDAFRYANQLLSLGVRCRPRPDLAYMGIDGLQYIVPFRVCEEPKPLSQEAQNRIKAAELKRLRRAARLQPASSNKQLLETTFIN